MFARYLVVESANICSSIVGLTVPAACDDLATTAIPSRPAGSGIRHSRLHPSSGQYER